MLHQIEDDATLDDESWLAAIPQSSIVNAGCYTNTLSSFGDETNIVQYCWPKRNFTRECALRKKGFR